MMTAAAYDERRERLKAYFDAEAMNAWAQLTSTARVSKIRETVRQGRDRMRATILSWLPGDLTGRRLLDAGCGTGALAIEAAQRGAVVTAIDVAGNLVDIARSRAPAELLPSIAFRAGDMLDPSAGECDHAVFMDSLIHYEPKEILAAVASVAGRTRASVIFTFAPQTPMLAAMHATGRLFPRANRAPAIEPVMEGRLRRLIGASAALQGWRVGRTERIASGFYTSQALELVRP